MLGPGRGAIEGRLGSCGGSGCWGRGERGHVGDEWAPVLDRGYWEDEEGERRKGTKTKRDFGWGRSEKDGLLVGVKRSELFVYRGS